MRVLVTGASGTLAPFVIRALWERHEVVLLSRRPPHAEFAALPWLQGDITVFDDCWRAVQGMDAIQHLAAQPWPVDHPWLREQAAAQGVPFDATFQSNMLGTYYLMQAAVAAGVERVVMAGSNCALGHGYRISQTPFPFQALPIDESHPAFPEDSYSYSKLAGELLLASYTRTYGIRTYVTRPAAICSPARCQQLTQQVETRNRYCAAKHDPDFDAEPDTMGASHTPPYYAIPLYPGDPNTKGGLRANARREVLDWDDTPIPRLYAAGEICSVFQFVYQGGGNLAECIVFGRIARQNAAAEVPLETA